MSDEQTAGAGESPDTEHDPGAESTEAPDADTMRAVAEALEATESGGDGPVITRVESPDTAPLPPRRG